jgi:hypothetical protein
MSTLVHLALKSFFECCCLYYTDDLWFWAFFLLVTSCYSGPYLTPSSACHSFCAIPLFFVNSVLLLMWSSYCYYEFSKMMYCTFSWFSAIMLKSFIYLFIYLFITQGLVIANHALHHLSQSDSCSSFLIILSHFSPPLWNHVCLKCIVVTFWMCKLLF